MLILAYVAWVTISSGREAAGQEINDPITAFDVSLSVNKYATAHSLDWTVRIWDLSSHQLLHTIEVPDYRYVSTAIPPSIRNVAFSPLGDRLAISPWGELPGLIMIVDTATGETLLEIGNMPALSALDWSPDGTSLVGLYDYSILTESETGGDLDHYIARWDATTGEELNVAASGVSPHTADWAPSGDTIIFPDFTRGVIVWNVQAWQELYSVPAEEIVSVAWSPTADRFASGGMDGIVRVWDGSTGVLLREITAGDDGDVNQEVFWSQDGEWVGRASRHQVQIWSATTGLTVCSYEADRAIHSVQMLADGSIIFASGNTVETLVISSVQCTLTVAAGDTAGLISAIEAANAIPDPDTICLAAGSTYTLTAAHNTQSGANGLPPITTDITIVGNGATITRDPAAPPFRLLLVTATGALTLEDVTLAGGLAGVAAVED